MIEILYNSELIGKFNKLTAIFRCGLTIEDILSNEEVQLAFVLKEGYLDAKAIGGLLEKIKDRCPRFTIKFTLKDKDYFINRTAFDSMTSLKDVDGGILLLGRQALYSRIEGVGELANPKEFPVEFIKNGFTIDE